MSSEKINRELKADPSKEAEQEKIFLEKMNRSLHGKTEELEKAKAELEKQLYNKSHSTKETEQELIILNSINKKLETKVLESKVEKNEISKEKVTPDPHQKIDSMLRLYKQITVPRLAEFTDTDISEVQSYLKTLESQGIVIQLQDRKETVCSDCSSLNIESVFQCPNCNGINYKQATLIEHYSCGNVSLQETYVDEKCPKCRKKIEVLGVDYKLIKDLFICRDCQNKFPEPKSSFQCQRCNTKFSMAEAKSKTSPLFKMK